MILNHENIQLVSTNPGDPEVKALLTSYEDVKNLTELHQYPDNMPTTMQFRIEFDGKVVGEVSLKSIRWFNRKAELSIFLAKEYRGRGLGKQALEAIMDYAFEKMNLHRLEAEVVAYNPDVVAMMKKMGFKEEGTLREAKYYNGKYYDIYRFGLLRPEYRQRWKK